MRNKLVAAAITGLVAAPGVSHAAPEVSWFGFNQITLESQGENANGDGGGLAFGVNRIRIGYKAQFDSGAHSKLQVDFNRTGTRGGAPRVIKDAVVGYEFNDFADVQLGMRKMPVGMDFNTSGKKLDIAKRSMEKDLTLERTPGAYLFGGTNSISYALAVGNPATRSNAVRGGLNGQVGTGLAGQNTAVNGDDYSYAARIAYDMGRMLHAEASYGTSTTVSNNNNAEDYEVFDLALKSQPMPGLTVKAEWIDGSALGHFDGRDQTVWYVHGGYEFTPMIEGVVRHYNSNAENNQGLDADLAETWIGANIFLNPEKHHEARIQLNYVLPSGDTDASDYPAGTNASSFHRTSLVLDDSNDATGTFLAQFQAAF